MTYAFADPTEWWLDIPASAQAECDRSPVAASAHPVNRVLHQLCASVFLPWFRAEYVPDAALWHAAETPIVWELVSGIAVCTATRRYVLLPSEAIDDREWEVPQEWIDLPDWVADYYLAVQVMPDRAQLRVWGYATHQQIKTAGTLDRDSRTYWLDVQQMTRDMTAFWVTEQCCPEAVTRTQIAPIPAIAPAQAESLIQRLSQPSVAFPRLTVPFSLWGALLDNDRDRLRFFQQRQSAFTGESSRPPIRLRQWLHWVDVGWESLESALSKTDLVPVGLRSVAVSNTTTCVKFLDLPTVSQPQTTLLLIAFYPEPDDRVSIRAQLHPLGTSYVPVGVTMDLLDASQAVLQSVSARDADSYIQLRRFRCVPETQFSLRIGLNAFSFVEDFLV